MSLKTLTHLAVKTFIISVGLPRWRSGEESACQCRRCKKHGFDPWIRKIPWRRGNSNPLQYSCQENPMFRGAWWATVYGITKIWSWFSDSACRTSLCSRYYSYFNRAHLFIQPLSPLSAPQHTQPRAWVWTVPGDEWENDLGRWQQSVDTSRLKLGSLEAESETGIFCGSTFGGKQAMERVK